MTISHRTGGLLTHGILAGLASAALALTGSAAFAQTPPPSEASVLEVPAKSVPVPTTVSPQMQKIIGLRLRTN